jgi:post-segregation antitoxin (ccd killing protein)
VEVPKVSVYLPDDLYRRAREAGLKLSAVTQAAIEEELDRAPNAAWIEQVSERPPRTDSRIDTPALLDEVREGFGA